MGRHELDETVIETADVAAFAIENGAEYVLVVRRLYPPYAGFWALPGGHVDPGEATPNAAVRELAEETGLVLDLDTESLVNVGRFDAPGRDPRGRYASTAYAAVLDHRPVVTAADDASEACWMPFDNGMPPLAFDHDWIVALARREVA